MIKTTGRIMPTAKNHWPPTVDGRSLAVDEHWHHWAFPNITNFKDHRHQYNLVVDWLHRNIDDCMDNARWNKIGDCFYIYLRNERDAVHFSLKFGAHNVK